MSPITTAYQHLQITRRFAVPLCLLQEGFNLVKAFDLAGATRSSAPSTTSQEMGSLICRDYLDLLPPPHLLGRERPAARLRDSLFDEPINQQKATD